MKGRYFDLIIEDYTLNKKFSDLEYGTCFVMYSEYYMKLFLKYNDTPYRNFALNLATCVAEIVKEDEKVRVVEGKMIIG